MSAAYSLRVLRITSVDWQPRTFQSKVPSLYARVALGDTVWRTGVIKDSLSPEWNSTFSFSSSDEAASLNIQVKHKSNLPSNLCIGFIDITLADLLGKMAKAPNRKNKSTPMRGGILHLHLKHSDARTNIANDIESTKQAVGRSDLARSSGAAYGTSAIVNAGEQFSGGSDFYKSLGELCRKIQAFVDAIDAISKIHPYVNVTWQIVSGLYKVVSSQVKGDQKVIELVQAMNEAFDFADEANAIREKARTLNEAINALLKQTAECCLFIQAYARCGFSKRMLDLVGRAKIDEFTRTVATLRSGVESGTNLSTGLITVRMSERVDALFLRDRLDPRQSNIFGRPQCLAGTCLDIQKQILAWMASDSDQNIFWLYGIAGSGKSTVSVTVAEYFSELSRCGAFLVFERGKNEPDAVIRTIAYELAMFDSSIERRIVAAIEQDNSIAMKSASEQFQKLLLGPLTDASDSILGPVVVVLDALDECGTRDSRHSFMKLLGTEFRKLPKNFRFLITSRPESDIKKAFTSHPETLVAVSLDFASKTSQEDVVSYLRTEMNRIVREESEVPVPEEWHWGDKIELLGKAAGGLFIWAATAVKLVSAQRDNPFEKLRELVENFRSLSLHELYATVLTTAISWEVFSFKNRFLEVLSLVLFSKESLTVATIDGLLGYPPESSSKFLLSGLSSVVDHSPDGLVRLFHASFSDYLLAPERLNDPWFIDVPALKTKIATRCFDVMKSSLRFNICGLESSHVLNESVQDLQARVKTHIHPHLLYACLFWAQHLREIPFSSQLMEQLTDFLYKRFLYWLEVLSLSKRLLTFRPILSDAISWTPTGCADILAFLKDATNLITSFYEGISVATPHIYISLLPLLPTSSRVAAHYLEYASLLVDVIRVGNERPLLLLKTLEGHSMTVTSVAFSPDGARIASGSDDCAVRVWNANSGEVVAGPFEGHSDKVSSVAFSPDGARIASGSDDCTVRVWYANNGEVVARPFQGHTDWVTTVAFSPGGARIASGSRDNKVLVWNAKSGEVVAGPFEGHSSVVCSVAYSPDEDRIASGSWDKTVRVWGANSGEVIAGPFEGHSESVMSVAFSPDGARIASGSHDNTILVWNANSGEVVAGPFGAHSSEVTSVAFSSDGIRIASGSRDNTILVWNANSGEVVAGPFQGHTDWVMSVAFSPDGGRIASGSYNNTILVWNANSGEVAAGPFEGHSATVASVAFSPDGAHLASGSWDKTVRVWDICSAGVRENSPDPMDCTPSTFGHSQSTPLYWTFDESGWLKSGDDLLLWIPPFLRGLVCRPSDCVFGPSFYVRLDLSSSVHGYNWQNCFNPTDDFLNQLT